MRQVNAKAKRGKEGEWGWRGRRRRLVSDYSLNASNEPENLLCAHRFVRAAATASSWTTGHVRRTKECTTNRCCLALPCLASTIPSLSAIYFGLSFVFVIQFCVCFAVQEEKQVQEKGKERFAGDIGQQISSRTWQATGVRRIINTKIPCLKHESQNFQIIYGIINESFKL